MIKYSKTKIHFESFLTQTVKNVDSGLFGPFSCLKKPFSRQLKLKIPSVDIDQDVCKISALCLNCGLNCKYSLFAPPPRPNIWTPKIPP